MLSTLRSTCIHFLLLNIGVWGGIKYFRYIPTGKRFKTASTTTKKVSIGNITTWFALSLNLLKVFFFYIGQVFVQTRRVMQTLIVSKRIDFYGEGGIVLMIETCIDILVLRRLLNSMT